MERLQLLKVKLIVKREQMSPSDAIAPEWYLPIDAIAKLEKKHNDIYSVTLKVEYSNMVHERYGSLETKLPSGSIQVFGE